MSALVDVYDMVSFDLDGVVYRGREVIGAAPSTIAELRRRGIRVGFVTNNAERSPVTVAEHLVSLGIPCQPEDVVTSAQATARIMAEQLPHEAKVFVLGSSALADEIALVGLVPIATRAGAAAICIGHDPSLTWADLNEGCLAVQAGAVWYACNDDLNRPTELGLAIGVGAMLKAMAEALPGRSVTMGGKPARPLFDETLARLGGAKPLFVGDRLDTDIEGANLAGWDSLFVLTGSHTRADLDAAGSSQHPTYVGEDIAALLAPALP